MTSPRGALAVRADWRAHVLVGATSAAVLAHQVALLRVLAIAHWHHAAQLVIAVALCGFGAAGTAIAVFPRVRRLRAAHAAALGYTLAVPASLWLASHVPFNALAVGWETGQWGLLFLLQVTFLVPFLLAALAVQIPFSVAGDDIGRLYGTSLVASGMGALGVLPLLSLGPPEEVLRWVALLPAAAAFTRLRWIAVLVAVPTLLWPGIELPMTRYKPLPSALAHPGAVVVETRHLPTARIDVVSARSLRHVEGLSLISAAELPAQEIVFLDGMGAGARIADDDPDAAAYFGDTLAAAAWTQAPPNPRVLVLGGAGNVEEVFANPGLVRRVDRAWTGENPRRHLAATPERYDVVLLRAADSVAMSEDALLTVEAFEDALGVLTPGGVFAVAAPLHSPPRNALKVVATARAAAPRVSALRSLDRLLVLMRGDPSGAWDAARLDAFCGRLGFDRIGADAPLHPAWHAEIEGALRGAQRAGRYRTEPATDDRPYFHRFLRWSRLGDALADARTLGAAHVDWGTLVVLVGALEVTLLGLLLAGLPLLLTRRRRPPPGARRYAVLHFVAIGVGYALVEAAFLGRLTVSLGAPEYAAGAVLGAFLAGSGLGSLSRVPVRYAAAAAAALAPLSILALPAVGSLGVALVLAAVVAFPLGVPFPGGLRRLAAADASCGASLVPLALAVNGCASVAAFALSPLLASDVGYSGMLAAAGVLYAAVALGQRQRSSTGSPMPLRSG